MLRLPPLLLCIFTLFTTQPAWSQTNPIGIFGPEVLCPGECGTWEFETSAGGSFNIKVLRHGDMETVFELNTQEFFFTWCPEEFGTFTINVVAFDDNGNLLGEGTFTVWVTEPSYYGSVSGLAGTNCEPLDSFFLQLPLSSPPNGGCREVCVGGNAQLSLQTIQVGNQAGGVVTINPGDPSSNPGEWVVTGPGTATSSFGDVTLQFTEPGTVTATYQLVVFSLEGCDIFVDIPFCFEVLPAPEAAFTTNPPVGANGLLEICEGQTVFFTNTSADAETFAWDFGDGALSGEENPSHTFTRAGTYEVTLATATTCDCRDTSSLTVVVEGNETPFVDCVATLCAGETVTYTATTGCTSYGWTVSANGTVIDGGGPSDDYVTIQWQSGPLGEISLETEGCPSLGTCTEAAYLQVPIVDDTAPIEGPTEVCRGAQTVYSLPPFQGTEFNWTVSSFGAIVAGQGTNSITVEWANMLTNTAQTISVDYTNCYLGCGGSETLTVFPRPEFYAGGPLEVCADEMATYTVNNTQTNQPFPALFRVEDETGTEVWTGPGPGNSAEINWNFGPGRYTLYAMPETAEDFCVSEYALPVRVYPPVPAPMTVEGQTAICPGISYNYAVTDLGPNDRFRWTINNGGNISIREGAGIAVSWGATPPYELSVVRLQTPLACTSEPTALAIAPVSGFNVVGDAQVCEDRLSSYTSDLTGEVYYTWSINPAGAGTITGDVSAENIEVLWHTAGPAAVVLDICGQQETLAVNVNAPPAPVVNHPAALCPNETAVVSTTTVYDSYSWRDTIGNELTTEAMPTLGPGYYRLLVTDAQGCTGTTSFHIYGYPESSISISTPDFTLFCNVPPLSRLFAVNTEDGYSYQWYQDGNPVPGATTADLTATDFGLYRVDIVDENGCAFGSDPILVAENCSDIRCNAPGLACLDTDFTIDATAICNERSYSLVPGGQAPLDVSWNFDDPTSGAANNASGATVSHTYEKPGFYRVLMSATFDDGMGGTTSCRVIRPDTVLMVADFDYDGVCAGAPVQFYDLTTFLELTTIASWSWDFGDPASGGNNVSTDKDPTHIFTDEGDFTVTLTVTSADGCTSSASKVVTVYPQPATAIPDPTVTCAATALAFTAEVAPTVTEVIWDFGDPGSGEADTSRLFTSFHAYAAPGAYTVSLGATSIYGCTNATTRIIQVTPNGLAGEVDPAGLSTLCVGDSLSLLAPGASPTSWAWSTGDSTQSITVHEAGVYSVTLTDEEGCTYTPAAATVDLIPAPVSPIRAVTYNTFNQPISYVYDTLYSCQGVDVYLETEQQAGYSYSWSSGDVDNTTEFSELRDNLLPAGEHTVSLTVTDNDTGCSVVEVFVVVVHPNPAVPVLDNGGNNPVCAGATTTISIGNPEINTTYVWSNGDTGVSITTAEAGDYSVRAVNAFGCASESEASEILAGPDIDLVPSGCHTRCAPDTICLPGIPDVVSYQWYQDGVAIPAPQGTVPELVIEQSGSYTLEMEDTAGCVQTSEPLNVELLPGYGNLNGVVYYDLNVNAMVDAPDSLAGGIVFLLSDATGVVATDTTGILGTYSFLSVPEGDYTLCIDTLALPAGWWPYEICRDLSIQGCDWMGAGSQLEWLLYPICEEETFLSAEICANATYDYFGDALGVGVYQFTYQAANGCDSIINLSVTALPPITSAVTLVGCPGGTVTFGGQSLPVGSVSEVTLIENDGCENRVTVTVDAFPLSTTEETVYVCPGETYAYHGDELAVGGPYSYIFPDGNGCDSTVLITVEAYTVGAGAETLVVCPGEAVMYQGQTLAVGSVTEFTLTAENGCDSTTTITVEALPIGNTELVVTVCPNETFPYAGQSYPAGTDEVFILANSQGCDSLVHLVVLSEPESVWETITERTCPGASSGQVRVTPIAGGTPFSYALDGGTLQEEANFGNLAAGTYELTVQDANGCQYTETINISALPQLVVDLPDQVLPCDSDTVMLEATIVSGDDGQVQFSWDDGLATAQRPVGAAGVYSLRVTNGCESVELSAQVFSELGEEVSLVYLPNAFSPNDDGSNDRFECYFNRRVFPADFTLQVFDRWGGLVWETNDPQLGWDGNTRGRTAPPAVYVWRLETELDVCGRIETITRTGDVVLIR